MSKDKSFLAVNGPLAGDYLSRAAAETEGYVMYNCGVRYGRADRHHMPTCVFVHQETAQPAPVKRRTPGVAPVQNLAQALVNFEQALLPIIRSRDSEHSQTTLSREMGNVYVKYITTSYGSRSVYCFVRKSDGAILKAATFKQPFIAKGGRYCAETIRGSIYASDFGMSACDVSGVRYIR